MASKLLLVSKNQEDLVFGQDLGRNIDREVLVSCDPARIEQALIDEPQSVVFVDADDLTEFRKIAKSIYGRISRSRVFIVTQDPLHKYPGLFDLSIFGHHLRRRYQPPSVEILGRIMNAAVSPLSFGIEKYFMKDQLAKVHRIKLDHSSKKSAAVEAIRNFLQKLGVFPRLAAKVAQASDELLMNAIYDAPVLKDGNRYRHQFSRQGGSFEIDGGVDLCFAEGTNYAAISVTDAFGSFDREKIMFSLKRDYKENNYLVRGAEPGVGIGLRSIILSDLSVLIATRPKSKTEAILFFPKVANFREIRTSFNYFGVLGL